MPTCDLYLRLSDLRAEEAFEGREAKLRAFAATLGWVVHRVVVENDVMPGKNRRLRPASAWKRRKIKTPSGRFEMRVIRPGFRSILDDIETGRASAMLAEDLDRVVRDPRDLEDLIDACQIHRASARSLTGSLTLTDGGNDSEIFMARVMVAQANKSSSDTSRRVADSHERLFGQSYSGGPRPYGYVHAQDTEKYHRTLIVVPDEAEVLRNAARDFLERDIGLRTIARELREKGLPTVKNSKWTAQSLRDALMKPTVAGLVMRKVTLKGDNGEPLKDENGQIRRAIEIKPAPWEPILDRDTWERLREKLSDPERNTGSNGHDVKWLLSGIGRCGICADGTPVYVTGGGSDPRYVCSKYNHLRRHAPYADDYIADMIVERLSRPDVKDLLKPPPAPTGVNGPRLRAEAKKLRERKSSQMRLHARGAIDDDDLAEGMKEIRDRLNVIEAQLAQSDQPDPLAEFRDRPAEAVWKSLPLARKRAVLRALMDVTFMPVTRRGKGFDYKSLDVRWKV